MHPQTKATLFEWLLSYISIGNACVLVCRAKLVDKVSVLGKRVGEKYSFSPF